MIVSFCVILKRCDQEKWILIQQRAKNVCAIKYKLLYTMYSKQILHLDSGSKPSKRKVFRIDLGLKNLNQKLLAVHAHNDMLISFYVNLFISDENWQSMIQDAQNLPGMYYIWDIFCWLPSTWFRPNYCKCDHQSIYDGLYVSSRGQHTQTFDWNHSLLSGAWMIRNVANICCAWRLLVTA